MKRILSIVLSTIILVTSCISVFAANNETTFSIWTDNNIYSREEEAMTLAAKLDRENLAYILVEAFDIDMDSKIEIQDVDSSRWSYPYICAVVNKGYMELENGRFFPTEYVKREQIPQYFKFLNISYPPIGELKFADIDEVEDEYSDLFGRFVAAGYLKPVSGEYLFPKRIITLTETINMLNAMFPNIPHKVLKQSTYDGHFLLKGENTYLSDLTITGDLIITEGIILKNKGYENNTVTIRNVDVKGNIYILGNSQYGKFVFENVKADNIHVIGEDPVIISFNQCEFNELNMGAKLANIVSDKAINIRRS